MAYITTYISTAPSTVEYDFDEFVELSTAVKEYCVKESYYKTNEVLDSLTQVPIPKQPSTGAYPSAVKDVQKAYLEWYALKKIHGVGSETTLAAKEAADTLAKELKEGWALIERQYSQHEIGFNYPVAGSSNASTAIMQVDRNAEYTGDTERTYTVTASSSANIGTATFSWSDGEGNTGTGTSSYDFQELSDGLSIRWYAGASGGVAIVSSDTWKIRCVPQVVKVDAPGNQIGSIPARN